MDSVLRPGVYKLFGKQAVDPHAWYQLLFTATFTGGNDEVDRPDVPLLVVMDTNSRWRGPRVRKADMTLDNPIYAPFSDEIAMFLARSHERLRDSEEVCVYVPLYHDKHGMRVSVRSAREWTECPKEAEGNHTPRFLYVGFTVPQSEKELIVRLKEMYGLHNYSVGAV